MAGSWTPSSGSTACSEVAVAGVNTRRLSTWCGVGLAATAGVVAMATLGPRYTGSGITRANYDCIAEGMTEAEVAAILGCPAGDYTGGRAMNFRCGMGVPFGLREQVWVGGNATILVHFREQDDRLAYKVFLKTYLWPEQSWFDRVKGYCRDALGL